MTHKHHLVDFCENIDAAVFSGDLLYQPDLVLLLEEYIERWNKAIKEHKETSDNTD